MKLEANRPLISGSRIPRLDFLRAISAAIVVIYHSGYDLIPAGFGVLTFFVISGFLITHLLLHECESTGTISFRNFYIRRSLRIFPAFYAYWIMGIVFLIVRHDRIIWGQAVCALFYVNNYYQGLHGYPSTLFSHTWSLGVEEQFYLLWPAFVFLFRNRLRRLALALAFVIPAIWIYRAGLHIYGAPDAYIYTAFETRVDAILVGCLVAILLHLDASRFMVARRPRYIPFTVAALAVSITCATLLQAPYRDIVGFAVDPLLVVLLILQLASIKRQTWMDSPLVVYLGSISYSTYLYQQLAIPIVRKIVQHQSKPIISLVCVIASWILASLSYRFIETPFLRLKKRFESSVDRRAVPA